MKIFIVNKTEKRTEKIIPYSSVSKTRYDNEEYEKLMKNYDSDIHGVYLANSEYYDFEVVDGEIEKIEEIIEEVEPYIESDAEKKARLENELLAIEEKAEILQARITAKTVLGLVSTTLESELETTLSDHLNISYDLAFLS